MTALLVQSSEGVTSMLQKAVTHPGVSEVSKHQAQELLKHQQVPWQQLRKIGKELQVIAGAGESLWLHQACQDAKLLLPKPPARVKSKELQDRLALLQKNVEQASYNRMVSDVTIAEQRAEALRGGALRTFKQQISFGLHVLVMMGTFYVFGHVAGAAISAKVSVRAACGMGGLVIAMLLETVLLIIRTTANDQPRSVLKQQQRAPQAPNCSKFPSVTKKQQ